MLTTRTCSFSCLPSPGSFPLTMTNPAGQTLGVAQNSRHATSWTAGSSGSNRSTFGWPAWGMPLYAIKPKPSKPQEG